MLSLLTNHKCNSGSRTVMAEHGPVQPMNVEQIVQQAEKFEFNPLVPFKHWSRSAGTLIKEVYSLPALMAS